MSIGYHSSVMEFLDVQFNVSPQILVVNQPSFGIPTDLTMFDGSSKCFTEPKADFDTSTLEMLAAAVSDEDDEKEGLVPDINSFAVSPWQLGNLSQQRVEPLPNYVFSTLSTEIGAPGEPFGSLDWKPNPVAVALASDTDSDFESESISTHSSSVPTSRTVMERQDKLRRRNSSNRCPLPRGWSDELLDMTTKQLNKHFKNKMFSPEKIFELKSCRRRIKNRTYTRNSRSRKFTDVTDGPINSPF